MQTSEQLRREQAGERMTIMVEDVKKLLQYDHNIKNKYKATQRYYGKEAISVKGIFQYLMNDKNGVANEENVLNAINFLKMEAMKKRGRCNIAK